MFPPVSFRGERMNPLSSKSASEIRRGSSAESPAVCTRESQHSGKTAETSIVNRECCRPGQLWLTKEFCDRSSARNIRLHRPVCARSPPACECRWLSHCGSSRALLQLLFRLLLSFAFSASAASDMGRAVTVYHREGCGVREAAPFLCVRRRRGKQTVMRAKTAVVLGAQWGDEGKGKIVDVLSERFSAVARYAGGHNAGHTVIIGGQKFVLQLIPCGVLRPACKGVIGNGVVLDPIAFLKEVAKLRDLGIAVDQQLKVSNRAQVILPYHRMIELAAESAPGRKKIGTTSRGIGPAYEDKMARNGLRIVDLLNADLLKTHIEAACAEKNAIAHALFGTDPLDPKKMYEEYAEAAEKVRPFVADTGRLLHQVLASGGSVMFEGAQ